MAKGSGHIRFKHNRFLMRIFLAALVSCQLFMSSGVVYASSLMEKTANDDVFSVKTGDPEMEAAFKKAAATLDEFIAAQDSKNPRFSDFTVKIPVVDGDETEYFWITDIKRRGKIFTGRLNNRPVMVHNVTFGQKMTFNRKLIRDWGYMDGDERKGNFTTCVIIKREPPEEAEQFMKRIGLTCKPL